MAVSGFCHGFRRGVTVARLRGFALLGNPNSILTTQFLERLDRIAHLAAVERIHDPWSDEYNKSRNIDHIPYSFIRPTIPFRSIIIH